MGLSQACCMFLLRLVRGVTMLLFVNKLFALQIPRRSAGGSAKGVEKVNVLSAANTKLCARNRRLHVVPVAVHLHSEDFAEEISPAVQVGSLRIASQFSLGRRYPGSKLIFHG